MRTTTTLASLPDGVLLVSCMCSLCFVIITIGATIVALEKKTGTNMGFFFLTRIQSDDILGT